MQRKKIFIGCGIVLLIVSIVVTNIYRSPKNSAISVQVFKVKPEKIETTVLTSGRIEAAKKEDITAPYSAKVEEVLVQEGDYVRAGQVLIRLDTTDLEQNLRQEEANLEVQKANLEKALTRSRPQEIEQAKAERDRTHITYNTAKIKYERNKNLFHNGAISRETLEDSYQEMVTAESYYRSAQQTVSLRLTGDTPQNIESCRAQINQAQVAVDIAREQFNRAQVKAPVDGTVLSLDAQKGVYVSTGRNLAIIGNPQEIKVTADVAESDSSSIAVGQPVKVTCSAMPDSEFSGLVTRVSVVAVTTSKSSGEQTDIKITIGLRDTKVKLKPGYNVDLEITTASKPRALVIPQDAVIEEDKVFIVSGGKVVKRAIKTGIGNELYLTVDKGLTDGDKVIVNPPENLKEKVAVIEVPYNEKPVSGARSE